MKTERRKLSKMSIENSGRNKLVDYVQLTVNKSSLSKDLSISTNKNNDLRRDTSSLMTL